MHPLTTLQGFSIGEIQALIAGRNIYIWGTDQLGQDTLTSLRAAGLRPLAFLHTSSAIVGRKVYGLPTLEAKQILAERNSVSPPFIVIATVNFLAEAERICHDAGYLKGLDYLTYYAIQRPQAIVEPASSCQLRCLACPQHNVPNLRSPAMMSLDTFRQVLSKLQQEIPLLSHVELSGWGEPLLNPELPQIIKHCESLIPCTVATNLVKSSILPNVLAAEPSRLVITAFGFGDSYERLMPGSSWQVFTRNLELLKRLVAESQPRTRITLMYFRPKDDPPENTEHWQSLLHGSNIRLAVESPYPMPYESILHRHEPGETGIKSREAIDILPWDLDQALNLSALDADQACLSQRIFPVINADLSVSLCHLYYEPVIARNFLTISWLDLLHLRHTSAHCVRCQGASLHRLDIPILTRRHQQLISTTSDQ